MDQRSQDFVPVFLQRGLQIKAGFERIDLARLRGCSPAVRAPAVTTVAAMKSRRFGTPSLSLSI
jgi:hypothetical protein